MDQLIEKYRIEIEKKEAIIESIDGKSVYELDKDQLIKVIEMLRTEVSMDDDQNWIKNLANEIITSTKESIETFMKILD